MKDSLPNQSPVPSGDQHPKKSGASRTLLPVAGIRERFKKLPVPHRIIFLIMTGLIIFTSTVGGVAYGVYAANQPVKLPIQAAKTTLQQFLQQAGQRSLTPSQVMPNGSQALPYWKDEPGEPKEQKPSAAPATMKVASVTIPASAFVGGKTPEVTPTPGVTPTPEITPTPQATATPTPDPTPTPGKAPTPTPTPGKTPTPTATPTPGVTPTPDDPVPTPTPTSEGTDGEQTQANGSINPLVTLAATPTPGVTPTPVVTPTPGVTPTPTPTQTPTTESPGATAVSIVGTDTNGTLLEIVLPVGSLDISEALTEANTAPEGNLTFTLTQLHGFFSAESKMLGFFQIQITDANGDEVHNLQLTQPATLIYHYQPDELINHDMDTEGLLLTWPSLINEAEAAGLPTDEYVLTMTNDPVNLTLSTETTVLDSSVIALAADNPDEQAPPTPRLASVSGNSGSLTYSYPFAVAPGPPGTTPELQLVYSSGSTNERHSPMSPAGWAGEGWSLSLGAITTEEQTINGNTKKWFLINGVDGVSDRLISNDNEQTFITEHLSHLKIKRIERPGLQPCFNVWDTSGDYYEFGCTPDSLQYGLKNGNRNNYRWDLNKFVPANNGVTGDDREMEISYVQVKINGGDIVRDSGPKEIRYGNGTARAGTVRFFYKGPDAITEGGITWVVDYGDAAGRCGSGVTTQFRCDNPKDRDGGLTAPKVMSVLTLDEVWSYVGTAPASGTGTTNLFYHYDLDYQDSKFEQCKESTTGTPAHCAGDHLLTKITPTVFQNGVGHEQLDTVFTYTGELENKYIDTLAGHTVDGAAYQVKTEWRYMSSYMDLMTGAGGKAEYKRAFGNTHGTPRTSAGDNRFNALFCTLYTTCTNNFNNPHDRQWSAQVVTKLSSSGKDSSASALQPASTTYQYWLTETSPDGCPADGSGLNSCVRYTWSPPDHDTAWKDYFHSEFRGFAKVLITSPSGDLTVQEYATTLGWETLATRSGNYTGGSLVKELVYAGGAINPAKLLKQTENFYAGYTIDGVNTENACLESFTTTAYKPCAVLLIKTKTTLYEQTGATNPNAPWVQSTFTYDNYNPSSGLGDFHQAPATGEYGNKLQEVIQSSNAPTVTKKWSYFTTDTTVSGKVYYNVRSVSHSELIDASNKKWACQDFLYDENTPSGVPKPAAGWVTTTKSYTNCADANTAIKSYTGYDKHGNVVATVDGVGAANPGLYSSAGCDESDPLVSPPTTSWSGSKYTTCVAYNATGAVPTDTWNAFEHHTATEYATTQGMLPTKVTDINSLETTTFYSYDSLGNPTASIKSPGEPGSYTSQTTTKSVCVITSTLPCLSLETNSSLYSTAVTRVFYDSLGRKVQTLKPGPGATQTTVTFVVYNDQNHTVFESVPFVVAARTTWLDPNGATDITGAVPGGTITTKDALDRVVTEVDPLGNLSRVTYALGSVSGTGDSAVYAITTTIDANLHVQADYSDMLGRVRSTLAYNGVYGGTLSAIKRVMSQFNALNKLVSLTITDLAPQSGQTITEVTTTSQYDDLGQKIVLNDPDRGTYTLTYNANGKIIKAISGSRIRGVSYDLLDRAICLQDVQPALDPNGACTSGANIFVKNSYDSDPGGSGVPWTSNVAKSKLTQTVATTYYPDTMQASVTENMQYDQRGRLISKRMKITSTGGSSPLPTLPVYQEQLFYNNANQPTTTQTTIDGQSGYTFTQAYESTTGMLIGLSNTTTGTSNVVALTYNEHALVSDVIFKASTGVTLATRHQLYDGNLRPASSTTTWQSSGTIYSDGISFDAIGNVLSRVTTHAAIEGISGSGGSETQNFCYDAQNRLKWASNNTAAIPAPGEHCGTATLQNQLGSPYINRYVYTQLGQLWQGPLGGTGAQQQYLYCNNGQPHQLTHMSPLSDNPVCGTPGTTAYTASYDVWGNMSTRTYQGQIGTLTFDALDHLTQWKAFASSKQEQYLYNAAGERVMRRSNDGTTTKLTIYAFGLEEHQYEEGGSSLNNTGNTFYYVIGGNLIGMLAGTTTLNTNFLLADTLGSVVSSFSNIAGSAQVLGNQLYDPYGNQRYKHGDLGTDKGYTGQYGDNLTGLNYYHARYYDALIGRFISADTQEGNLQGIDPYVYVGGNPETKNDPTGHKSVMPGKGGGRISFSQFVYQLLMREGLTKRGLPFLLDAFLHNKRLWAYAEAYGQNELHESTIVSLGAQAYELRHNSGINWNASLQLQTLFVKLGAIEVPYIMEKTSALEDHRGTFLALANAQIARTLAVASSKALQKNPLRYKGKECSFTATTPVTTDHGKRDIGTLRIGDQVWAYNPVTQQMEWRLVKHVWINQDDDLVDLTIETPKSDGSDQAEIEVIHTNKKHPFLTVEQGFLPAGKIIVGMQIVRADGRLGIVTQWKVVPGSQTMYNLEVAQVHTFTVGEGQWIVHNCPGGDPTDILNDVAPTLERIMDGAGHPHRNDGTVFRNREGRLPTQPDGYYHEFVVPTPGVPHAGPQRLIIGSGGEIFFTGDHYGTFTQLN